MNPLFVDLAAFAGTVAVAIYEDWQARDLIWSLWLSSLILGYLLLLTNIVKLTFWPDRFSAYMTREAYKAGPSVVKRLFFGVFFAAFFSIHFLGFHAGHAFFLHMFVPRPGGVPALLGLWPFVLASAVSLRGWFLQSSGDLNFVQPYVSVIKMHVMIFVFIGVDLSRVERYAERSGARPAKGRGRR